MTMTCSTRVSRSLQSSNSSNADGFPSDTSQNSCYTPPSSVMSTSASSTEPRSEISVLTPDISSSVGSVTSLSEPISHDPAAVGTPPSSIDRFSADTDGPFVPSLGSKDESIIVLHRQQKMETLIETIMRPFN